MDGETPFLFAVADTFVLRERGIVAFGRIESGVARVGDAVEVWFAGRATAATVAGFEIGWRPCFGPPNGDQRAILLRGVAADEIGAGAVIRAPAAAGG